MTWSASQKFFYGSHIVHTYIFFLSVVNTCDLIYFVSPFISKRRTQPPQSTIVCNNKAQRRVCAYAYSSLYETHDHFNLIFIFCRHSVACHFNKIMPDGDGDWICSEFQEWSPSMFMHTHIFYIWTKSIPTFHTNK